MERHSNLSEMKGRNDAEQDKRDKTRKCEQKSFKEIMNNIANEICGVYKSEYGKKHSFWWFNEIK